MKKNWGYHLTRGKGEGKPSRSEGRGVDATFSVLRKHKFAILKKKYLHTMMLKLTEHVGITISLLYKQKTR